MTWKKLIPYIPITCIIMLASLLRFTYLDRIPNGISGDELTYILTAKSVYLTGHDISGTWTPWSAFFFRYPPNQQQAELPYFLHLPFSGPLPFSLLTARFPFALLSVGIVILLYTITLKFFDRQTAFITGLMASVNPWLIYMGRTAYESTPATFFYLLGFYILLILQKYKLLIALPIFLLAFYSYIGMKIIFLPLVLLFCAFARFHNKQDQRIYGIICTFCLFFTIFFVFAITSRQGSRLSDLFLPNAPIISQTVDAIRKNTIENPLTPLYINKLTIYAQIIITKFYRMLSPVYLFLEGDQFFSLYRHGFFYAVDFLFLSIGIVALYVKKRGVFYLLFIAMLLSIAPHLLHATLSDFSGHITLLFPFGVIAIGSGINIVIRGRNKKSRLYSVFIITIVYVLSLGNFLLVYFFQYPLNGYANFDMRILSKYLMFAKTQSNQIYVYSDKNRDFLYKFLFYTNGISKDTLSILPGLYKTPFTFQGIHFASCDITSQEDQGQNIAIYDESCNSKNEESHVSISRLSDAGINYRIINDITCQKYQLKLFPSEITIQNFTIEQLSEKRFCETFITR